MGTPGYLYVLVNPSMEGLVKVGRTARNPNDRVNELSNATGVPTSFLLVFRRFFNDTERAEQLVHELLEEQGYRISPNREFFNAPPHEVIEAIIQIDDISPEQTYNTFASNPVEDDEKDILSPSQGDDFLDKLEVEPGNPGKELMELADNYYYGLGETLQDYSEALRLYKQAARMGAIEAYRKLGDMYYLGQGCNPDSKKALDFWKEGVKKGDNACYAEMAGLFTANKQYDNAKKCWKRFFNSDWVGIESWEIVSYCYGYLWNALFYRWELDYFEELKKNKHDLQILAEKRMKSAKESNNPGLGGMYQIVADFISRLPD